MELTTLKTDKQSKQHFKRNKNLKLRTITMLAANYSIEKAGYREGELYKACSDARPDTDSMRLSV